MISQLLDSGSWRFEFVDCRAELTGDGDVAASVRMSANSPGMKLPRNASIRSREQRHFALKATAGGESHAFFVEQAEQQRSGDTARVEQLVILDRRREQPRALPILVLFASHRGVVRIGLRGRQRPRIAADLRHVLQHQTTGPPMPAPPRNGARRQDE